MSRPSRQRMRVEIDAFLNVWPEAEFGPAHIVVSDRNLENCHIAWCDGWLSAVIEARRVGAIDLHASHSDAELEATRLLLLWLRTGESEWRMLPSDPIGVQVSWWRDVCVS